MGCCPSTPQIFHDLEVAIQQVKQKESSLSMAAQGEEEYAVPPRYMYLKQETPFLVPPIRTLSIHDKCVQDLKGVIERANIESEKLTAMKTNEVFQQLFGEAQNLFEKYKTNHQRDMQTVTAATNRAKFEQPSNMIIINLLNVLWKTQWYGIKDFERTNCIHLLLNVSEKLIRDFLDFNNLKTIEKIEKENVTNLQKHFQKKISTNLTSFAKLSESCRHWIQIGKKESIIMSKFQIFKQFSADLTNIQDIIKARIELAKILDPAFGETLIASDPNALVTYTKIDTNINNCIRLKMNQNSQMIKKAFEIRRTFGVEILHMEREKMTDVFDAFEQDDGNNLNKLLTFVKQARGILEIFHGSYSTNPIYIEIQDMQTKAIQLHLDECLNLFPKLKIFDTDDDEKFRVSLENLAQRWNGGVFEEGKECSKLSILVQKNGDNKLFEKFVNKKDEIVRGYVNFSLEFDGLDIIDHAIGFGMLLGLSGSDPVIQKAIAEKEKVGFAQMRRAIKKCQNGLNKKNIEDNMFFFNSLSYLSEKDDLLLSWKGVNMNQNEAAMFMDLFGEYEPKWWNYNDRLSMINGVVHEGISKYYHANGSMISCETVSKTKSNYHAKKHLVQWQLKNRKGKVIARSEELEKIKLKDGDSNYRAKYRLPPIPLTGWSYEAVKLWNKNNIRMPPSWNIKARDYPTFI